MWLGALGLGGVAVYRGCIHAPVLLLPSQKARLPLQDRDALVHTWGLAGASDEQTTRRAVREAALAATDFSWLSKGDTVLIKPAVNSGNVYPATTDPWAIAEMVTLLRERGACRVIVGDQSGVESVRQNKDGVYKGSTRALMVSCGIRDAAEAAGGEVIGFEEAGWGGYYEDHPACETNWVGPVWLPRIVREADHIVLMPRVSRHVLAGSTLGMKNAVGWWRQDSRLEYHREASTFHEKTAEANWCPSMTSRLRLVLTSARQSLIAGGPDSGYVDTHKRGMVFASTSLVAHDMVSLAWLLESRRHVAQSLITGLRADPYRSSTTVSILNRVVTSLLGGWGEAIKAEPLARHDIHSIWDDRVLRRAFEIEGGIPPVKLVQGESALGEAATHALESALASPV